MPAQDKTEAPTPKRRSEARKKGQVARSVEVNTAMALLISWLVLRILGQTIFDGLAGMAGSNFAHLHQPDFTQTTMKSMMVSNFLLVGKLMAPLVGALLLAGVLANIVQVGFVVS
ncbi:MAG: EscU/YscU/HrcU family type III secretion system export apparatus switch protein, partial [Chloroflexota bacterium]|nr:EscU/YscU/HrcU family type III secretion system export apparatus switch protein [Chloroflexota bacterium]